MADFLCSGSGGRGTPKRTMVRLVFGAAVLGAGSPASAQIATDGTLGVARDLVGPDYLIDAELGRQVGDNLFFSFDEFSLPTGTSATWTGPASIEHIINRITGGAPSEIDGTLRVQGMPSADFWFINPAGVTFGPNASLDVPASVHVSTADALRLGSSGLFGTAQPGVSLLTGETPSGFDFHGPLVGAITINGAALRVGTGSAIDLVGGDIRLDAGQLIAPGGRVQVVSVASSGEVDIADEGSLSAEDFAALGTVHLSRTADQELSFAGNLDVSSPSAGIDAGRVDMLGGRLVSDAGGILSFQRGDGVGGGIHLDFRDAIDLHGFSQIRSDSLRLGTAGDIQIETARFLARGQTEIGSDAAFDGDGGNIRIVADSIELRDSAGLASNTRRAGQGGDVHLVASGDITLADLATIRVETSRTGNAGNIELSGQNIRLHDSATLQASTFTGSSGAGGTIRIDARNTFEMVGNNDGRRGSSALISVETNGSGAAGSVEIAAGSILIGGDAVIESSATASGDAGALRLIAADLQLIDAAIESRSSGSGRGGQIDIAADTVLLAAGASISAESSSTGDAGDVLVEVADTLEAFDSSITTAAISADGGNIHLRVGGDTRLERARIETAVQSGVGDGGNLLLDAGELVVLRDSQISANAFGGDGGNIDATAQFFILSSTSSVTASSALGVDGVISFSSPEVDLAALSELNTPPEADADRVALVDCARASVRGSKLQIRSGRTDSCPTPTAVEDSDSAPAPASP